MTPCVATVENAKGKARPCGCKSVAFYKVEYSKLVQYRQNEAKFFDIFGFCKDHAVQYGLLETYKKPEVGNVHAWNYGRGMLYGLRGEVAKVEPYDSPDADNAVRQDQKQRRAASFKSDVKRMMNQKNSQKMTLVDWEITFNEILQEFVVEGVMES